MVLSKRGKNLQNDLNKNSNPFLQYNQSIIIENNLSHNFDQKPTLKSKLLFMDFQFNVMKENTLSILDTNNPNIEFTSSILTNPIIKIGRFGYSQNDIQIKGGNAISRRHAVIINAKDNVWLYDLDSTGLGLNDEKVIQKVPLIGYNKIRLNNISFSITTDNSKLL